MTATNLLDHERLRLAACGGLLVVLLGLFAAAAAFWATEPFALLVLAIPFTGTLTGLVKLGDYLREHAA